MSQAPSIGRIVHIVQSTSPEHLPAMICHVHPLGAYKSIASDGYVLNVAPWDPQGNPMAGIQGIPEDQSGERHMSWHWPERVDPIDEELEEPEDDEEG